LFFSWLYRILLSVLDEPFVPIKSDYITNQWDKSDPNTNQTPWKSFEIPSIKYGKKRFS
jgi:homogentisate 1,2-dioxygenase